MRKDLMLFLLGTFLAHTALSDDLTIEEREVWALEIQYYEFARNNDPEGYLGLFNDSVIGWPTTDPLPKGKNKVSQWITAVHSNPEEIWQYELERLAIQSHGDVVVVHYRLRDYFVSAASGDEIRSQQFRITHTWIKRDNRWQIAAGMGGNFNHLQEGD